MISRRRLLKGVSALALGVALSAWTHGKVATSQPAFGGNPNVTITAINTTGACVGINANYGLTAGTGGTSINATDNGGEYNPANAGYFFNVPITSNGAGTGTTANIVISNKGLVPASPAPTGGVIGIYFTDPGTGHAAGDILTASSGNIGGTTGFQAVVQTVGIALSRKSGSLPAFVQASACNISCTGSDNPYEDLEYRWNFGDASGAEILTNPAQNTTVNANSDQYGPEAAYVYRTAGTYTITLTIRGQNGAGFTTATCSVQFTANAFSPASEQYWDSNYAGGGSDGTIAKPWVDADLTTLNTFVGTTGRRANIKRGSSWTVASTAGHTSCISPASGTRIQAYGSGAVPTIGFTGSNGGFDATLLVVTGTADVSDIAISGVSFSNSSASLGGSGGCYFYCSTTTGNGSLSDIYFDNCAFAQTNAAGGPFAWQSPGDGYIGTYVWNTGFWNCTGTSNGGGVSNLGVIWHSWGAVVGGSMGGQGGGNTFSHYSYSTCNNHMLFKWVGFGRGRTPGQDAGSVNFALNLRCENHDGFALSKYCCVADCEMTGSRNIHCLTDSMSGGTLATCNWQYVVIQSNAYHDFPSANELIQPSAWCTFTERDNRIWNISGRLANAHLSQIALYNNGSTGRCAIYRNKMYSGLTTVDGMWDFADSGTKTKPTVYTDNQIWNTIAGNAIVILVNSAWEITANSTYLRNQYYAPSANQNLFSDNGTRKSLAAWRSFTDANCPSGFDAAPGGISQPAGWTTPITQWQSFG